MPHPQTNPPPMSGANSRTLDYFHSLLEDRIYCWFTVKIEAGECTFVEVKQTYQPNSTLPTRKGNTNGTHTHPNAR